MAARHRRRRAQASSQRLILDAGAVIALSHGDQRVRSTFETADKAGVQMSVPAVVVAETVRGSAKDAPVDRVLKRINQVDIANEAIGRLAGRLLGAVQSSSTVDAIVVATAVEAGGAVVLTGDPGDLGPLAARHPEVVIKAL